MLTKDHGRTQHLFSSCNDAASSDSKFMHKAIFVLSLLKTQVKDSISHFEETSKRLFAVHSQTYLCNFFRQTRCEIEDYQTNPHVSSWILS